MWLPGLGLANPYWQFVGTGLFWTQGDGPGAPDATLTGTVDNNGSSGNTGTVSLEFTWVEKGRRTPYCEYSSTICNDSIYQDRSDFFECFNLTSATFSGTSGDVDDLELTFSQYPAA